MAQLVFFGFPARGHTAPSLPVTAELVRRGHEVDYYSTPAFAHLVENTGANFVAYPAVCESLARPLDLDDHLVRGLDITLQMLPVLCAALERRRPDLVMFDASALWGGILARRFGLPCAVSITTFAVNRTMLQMLGASARTAPAAWSATMLEQLNVEYAAGLRDHVDLMVPRADLSLVYTSREFQPAGKFFDARHLFVGPLLTQRPRDGAQAVGAVSRPLAYVSLGTIFNRDARLLRLISDVLAARGWQVIVSLGDAAAAQTLQWPEHVQVHAFVDQIGVLAQARLFVTHGGMNSVSEALAYAVPMIVIPQGVDQHLVAKQVASLGAGIVIEGNAVSEATLAAAAARIEQDRPTFVAAAEKLQQSFSAVMPIASALDAVLALIPPEPGNV